ncbi:MAG: twin-arginine translocase subunit TatC [Bacteroidales bacterium]|nr:twin-arginine translocase subunit TatC [Bacteroidales bacterium]
MHKAPFIEHLEVMRRMLLRIFAVLMGLMMIIFWFKEEVFKILLAPKEHNFVTYRLIERLLHRMGNDFVFEPYHLDLINTQLSGQFMEHLSISFYLGCMIASPYILFEILGFVTPALYEKERRYLVPTSLLILLLFSIGAVMNYFVLFPISFRFLGTYQVTESVHNMITLESYTSTFITLTLSMGLIFQLPILSFFLSKIGILKSSFMQQYRKHALVAIMIVAAIITPPDVFTLVLVTFPLYLLYEFSILVVSRTEN